MSLYAKYILKVLAYVFLTTKNKMLIEAQIKHFRLTNNISPQDIQQVPNRTGNK